MPNKTFAGELERLLLEIWSAILEKRERTMVTRAAKQKAAVDEINKMADLGRERILTKKRRAPVAS